MQDAKQILRGFACGGADFIQHRQNGLLIEPGSASAIEQELVWSLTHRSELFQIGQAARVEAEKEKSETKLAKFTDKVPPAVVEQERVRLADWNTQLAGLREQRAKL